MTDHESKTTAGIRKGLRLDDADAVFDALTPVVDYRGDVTIVRRSGGDPIEGYVFDCIDHDDRSRARLRLLPKAGGGAVSVPLDDIAAIEITGRDTAEGKSFDTWVKKYVEKKKAGQPASIESDLP